MNNGYGHGSADGAQRVVVLMPKDEAEAVEEWGIPGGTPSRTSAVRFLLRKVLDAIKAQENRRPAG